MNDLDYIEMLHERSEQAEASFRAQQNRRERRLFIALTLLLLACATTGVLVCRALWLDAAGPEEPRPALKAPLEPGQSQWKGNKLERYSF